MTPSQHVDSPKYYYTYGYSGAPGASVVSMYPIGTPGAAALAPASQPVAPTPYTPRTPAPAHAVPAIPARPSPASGDAGSPPVYAYHHPQSQLGAVATPSSLSPVSSPQRSPNRFYYAQFGPMIAPQPGEQPSGLSYGAQQIPRHSPGHPGTAPGDNEQLESQGSVVAVATQPYFARHSRRMRRKSEEEVSYAMNYPNHPVPEHMFVATGPPGASFKVMPPRPEEIRARRYATGVDERNFFTVLEYKINEQPIIWDYYTGYVHLTGIWKAIGHAKADIVKLLDNSPELEPIIKRVRGGFLKIQGTWVPFEVAHRLAKHVCYYIRYALVPIFGPGFPSECTKPNEPGFGQLHLNQSPRLVPLSQSLLSEAPQILAGNRNASAPSLVLNSQASSSIPIPASHHQRSLSNPHSHSQKQAHPLGAAPVVRRSSHRLSDGSGSREVVKEGLKEVRKRRDSGLGRSRTYSGSQHSHSDSFNAIRRALEKQRLKIDPEATANHHLIIDAVDEEIYDENVFEDEDAVGSVSPPPMPRKVSFTDEQRVSESPSELIEMLKATRSLQQMSAGRKPTEHWVRSGGGFELAGRQFMWDGSDRLDVVLDVQNLSKASRPLEEDMIDVRKAGIGKAHELTPPPPPFAAAGQANNLEPLAVQQPHPLHHHEQPQPQQQQQMHPQQQSKRLPSLANILNIS